MADSDAPKISVVVPVYNSSSTLFELHQRIQNTLKLLAQHYEIVFVDDNSLDNSWEVLKDIVKRSEHVKIFRLSRNIGQWVATLCGIEQAKGEYIATIDDDLQFNPEDIVKLFDYLIRHDQFLVYGIPEKVNRWNRFHQARNKVLNFVFKKDPTSSFKIFNRSIILSQEGKLVTTLHFEAFAQLNINRKLRTFIEVPFNERLYGKSNYNIFKKINLIATYGMEYYSYSTRKIFGWSIIVLFASLLFLLFATNQTTLFQCCKFEQVVLLFFLTAIFSYTLLGIIALGIYYTKTFILGDSKLNYDIIEEI